MKRIEVGLRKFCSPGVVEPCLVKDHSGKDYAKLSSR